LNPPSKADIGARIPWGPAIDGRMVAFDPKRTFAASA
jgi:hypothetical protein